MPSSITGWLGGLSGPVVYGVVAALVFCEDALFFGFVVPGETAVVVGGALAGHGEVSVWWLAAVVVLAAVTGDSVGYEIGRRFGPVLLTVRPLRSHLDRVEAARNFYRRRGAMAVFLGRFVAFLRAMVPALAGISGMRYRTFLVFNALGGLIWGVGFTLLGYFVGAAYGRIEHLVGRAAAGLTATVAIIAFLLWRLRHHRSTKNAGKKAREEDRTGFWR
ncbi:SNARE associated Golgi protein [Thermomonospora echinospora]|uniref:SNARE associated Golgi protein n=1 Tax=Thermomonospora echinospora TaxID=1992 RepID=A0A1H6D8R8_9ACTN|nr:DedA family protein [Thermomonospora echinospora]SEG81632.1 SNARE associated Golgi protein [Thermomonospora echinospora]